MDKYIGFDISSKDVSVCVIQKNQRERYATIGPDAGSMRKFLVNEKKDGSRVNVTFEISGQAGFLYDSLIDCVDSIKVANPDKMTWIYRTSKKNDRFDARKMAVLLSIGEIPAVHMPSKEVRQWRMIICHRKKLLAALVTAKNRIRALLKSQGISSAGNKGKWWNIRNRLWMRQFCGVDFDPENLWRMQMGNLLDELEQKEKQVALVTEYLDGYLDKQAGGELLMSIRGVGPRTAEAVLAFTDDVERFASSKEYCGYFGVTPKLDESGSSRRLGHISKKGPSVVRWVLVESSWKVIRYSTAIRAFYDRVRAGQKGRKKIAIVAVARKLLSIMRAMLLTGATFDDKFVSSVDYGKIEMLRKSA
ncbi:MAG: IS110 family transposase [Sedimentisphaerales bacterium]